MQASPPETGTTNENGFLQNSFIPFGGNLQKPVFWIILFVFFITIGIGYWLGGNLVISPENQLSDTSIIKTESNKRVITLLEVTDLTAEKPELISIWFIHINPGDKPHLGFSPVSSRGLEDETNLDLLGNFTLDESRNPSDKFIQLLGKLKVSSSGYVMLDQVAVKAFINWFEGSDGSEQISLENHSMAEYGQILRNICNSFPEFASKEVTEFPWTKLTPSHFSTSLRFNQVITNMSFLTSSNSPQCETVPIR